MFVCGCMKDDVGVVESCLRLHTVTVAYITYDRQDGAVWKSFLQLHIYFVSGGFRKSNKMSCFRLKQHNCRHNSLPILPAAPVTMITLPDNSLRILSKSMFISSRLKRSSICILRNCILLHCVCSVKMVQCAGRCGSPDRIALFLHRYGDLCGLEIIYN